MNNQQMPSEATDLYSEYLEAHYRYSKLKKKLVRAESMENHIGIGQKTIAKLKEKVNTAFDRKSDCLSRINSPELVDSSTLID